MTLPAIGSNVSVTLGDQQVSVKVTATNQKMLEDGDLTNDLQAIKAADGDASSVTAQDFIKAGFDPNQSQHMANVASGVKPLAYNPGGLPAADQTNLAAIIAAKPSITGKLSGPANQATMTAFLNTQTITGRNGIIAELANETAMMAVRQNLLNGLNQKPTGSGYTYNQVIAQLGSNSATLALRYMGGDTPANRQLLADKIMTAPDMSLGDKHALLNRLGFTDTAANNTSIANAMTPLHQQIKTLSEKMYSKLGGTGTMPETIAMASGDGTGTLGLAGQQNCAIGLMHYSEVATASANRTVSGIQSSSETFTPTDQTKPVAFHFSANGVDFKTDASSTRSNTLSIQHDGQTITFDIAQSGNNTTISLKPGTTLPPNVSFDPASNTLTFPPSATPYVLTQNSAAKNTANGLSYDEIFTSVGVINASANSANINMNLNGVFKSDRFAIGFSQLSDTQQQQLDGLAKWLIDHPDQELTVSAGGKGPTWWDGSRPAEMAGYGTEQDGTTKAQLTNLRSTSLVTDVDAGTLSVNATTDPVQSNLGDKGKTPLDAKGFAAYKAFVGKHPGLVGNDVLSGMRAFATLELVQKRLTDKGAGQKVLTDDTKVQLPNGQSMTYADYKAINHLKPQQ